MWPFDILSKHRQRQYDAAFANARAYSESQTALIFHSWTFKPETMALDPEAATLDQLENALSDCWTCVAVEYPETDAGTHAAETRSEEVNAAINRRFAASAAEVIARAEGDAWNLAKARSEERAR